MPVKFRVSDDLPDKPGVYLMRDIENKIIYVGKALSLKKRVKSYFNSSKQPIKTKTMMKHFQGFEYIITDTEKEALILESNLIKKYRPRYNVRLKDDKRYPYIKITNEGYPRILFTRTLRDDGGVYYGPFTDVKAVKKTIKFVESLFKIRDCKKMDGPCLNFQINLCSAPCEGKITRKSYSEIVDKVNLFFEGKYREIMEMLDDIMKEASLNHEYEKAAVIRDQIDSIKDLMEKQKVSFTGGLDQDIVAISINGKIACAVVFSIREGKIMGKDDFFLSGVENRGANKILAAFLKQYYSGPRIIPAEIFLEYEPDESKLIADWLADKRGDRLNLNIPKKGTEYRLVQMAARNAESIKNQKKNLINALFELKKYLQIPTIPRHIEAFDVSNISGKLAVGSLVVFENGLPKKNHYRKYRLKKTGPDDYAMMEEVLKRRYMRLSREQGIYPDLVLVDGGRGQVNVALKVLKDLNMDMPVIGLAKGFEHIFIPQISSPIILRPESEALHLLQRVRDEAHRFAITYHKKIRSNEVDRSELDEIKGVGKKRKMRLLRHFGDLNEIRKASVAELREVKGINRNLAISIYKHLRMDDQRFN